MNLKTTKNLPSILRALLCVGLLAGLAACGGGGGSDTTPPPTNTLTAGTALTGTTTGHGTYYGATGTGSCGYDASPQNLMVAAINTTDFAGSAMCGAYVKATGPKGTVTVRIVDSCPTCAAGDIDFSAEAFALIGDPAVGTIPISWQVVVGDVSTPVSYHYADGSSRYWFGIQVLNHRVPITALAVRPAGAADWINLTRESSNYFTYATGIAAGQLQVRITGATGTQLIDTLPEPAPGVTTAGHAQF